MNRYRRTITGVEWAADADATQCTNCGANFTVFLRRHHCRVCGQIFCGPCSSTLVVLPDSDKQQRVCDDCKGIVGELAGRAATEQEGEDAFTPVRHVRSGPSPAAASRSSCGRVPSTEGLTADLLAAVLADSQDVLECLPSHSLSVSTRPCADSPFAVELPTAALWDSTMCLLSRAGRWAFQEREEVLKAVGKPLDKLVRPLAQAAARRRPRINFRAGTGGFAVGQAVRVFDPAAGGWREGGEVIEVQSADAFTQRESMPAGAVKVLFNGQCSTRWFSPVQARKNLDASRSAAAASRVVRGMSVEDFIATEEPPGGEAGCCGPSEESDQRIPNNLSTRVGGIYHETLAVRFAPGGGHPSVGSLVGTSVLHVEGDERSEELLTSGIAQVFGDGGEGADVMPTLVVGRHGRADTPAKAQQLFHLIRFALTRCNFGPHAPRPRRVRICSLLNALVLDGRERGFFQGQLSVLTEHAGERRGEAGGPSGFNFASAMEELGLDYSCLNFVANWPLCLRLGVGPPSGRHNVQHSRGLRRHLVWLAQDVLSALELLPQEWVTPCVEEQRGVLRCFCTGEGAVDAWREALPAVRLAIDMLRPAAAREDAGARDACNRFFMAAELLGQLGRCEGTTFRRRAGELLQLCILEHILGVVPFFNCKSGVDRTGVCVALWTTVHQLLSSGHAQLWVWHYLALLYPLLLKLVHGLHDCGKEDGQGKRSVPLPQLREGCSLQGRGSLLPFPPEPGLEEERQRYTRLEQLCTLSSPNEGLSLVFPVGGLADGGAERIVYGALESIFFKGPQAVLPQLQAGFFSNIFGVATKVAVASTGLHGLKYGDSNKTKGQFNSLAAQFMPRVARCAETGASVAITEVRKSFFSTEVAFAADVEPYLIGSSCGRGT